MHHSERVVCQRRWKTISNISLRNIFSWIIETEESRSIALRMIYFNGCLCMLDDLQEIMTQATEDMKKELGEKFDLQ